MPRISKAFITERLLPSVSIDRLIGSYIQLQRSGSEFKCCCPFHREKTPSFYVVPSKQLYYCFGCHAHGNAISFLMDFKNLGYKEAIEELARHAGLPIEYEQGQSPEEDHKLTEGFEIMNRLAEYFSACLQEVQGREALDYLRRVRELSDATIRDCRLGYAPADADAIMSRFCRGTPEQQMLLDLGVLTRTRTGGLFPMLRNRAVIPIRNRKGQVVGFGGRTLGKDEPKYLNTRESLIYHKRQELFGLYETLEANRNRPERFVVVEGYLDVISLRQAGCTYAVAPLGTATTAEQIRSMLRYSSKIVFCYDGDQAGRRAAWHAFETVTPFLEQDRDVRFAFLPDDRKVDPDSLVREQGLPAFLQYLDKAESYPEFLIRHTAGQYDLRDAMQRSAFINSSVRLIKRIPLPALQAVAVQILSRASSVQEDRLNMMLDQISEPERGPAYRNDDQAAETDRFGDDGRGLLRSPMRRLMAFALQQPVIISSLYDDFALEQFMALCASLKVRGTDELKYIIGLIRSHSQVTPAVIMEEVRGTPREGYCSVLINAQLHPEAPDGSEWSWSSRVAQLARLLSDVIKNGVEQLAGALSQGAELNGGKYATQVADLRRMLHDLSH